MIYALPITPILCFVATVVADVAVAGMGYKIETYQRHARCKRPFNSTPL